MAAQLAEMTGMPEAEAQGFLEMAGGDLDTAMSLYFSMMDDGPPPAPAAAGLDAPDWFGLVWPSCEPLPDCWAGQGLEFSPGCFGIPQHKNGPCGVLAAVQAVVAVQAAELSPTMAVPDSALVAALASIISQARPSAEAGCTVALWPEGTPVADPAVHPVAQSELAEFLERNVDQFKKPGGCVLLVYACLLTRGPEQVTKDMASEMESGPLILAPTYVCSMPLMGLLLKGVAQGSISAYTALGGAPQDWPAGLGVGLLSFSEVDSGIPICDALKSPSSLVWILHGGDHFTVAFSQTDVTAAQFELWHYNGLPPAGPRMTKVPGWLVEPSHRVGQVTVSAPHGVAPKAPPGPREDSFLAPVPGQVEGVVQCRSSDKEARPDEWKTWRCEHPVAFPSLG